jgi:N-methylhydantoinase B
MKRSFDETRVLLFTEMFASVAEDMGSALERISFSPNIKERRDYSCALFDTRGRLIAQAAHIPVHLGAMEILIQHWLHEGPKMERGKFYITNDPFFAGTHLPDITLVYPVDVGDRRIGYVANRAHHTDVGGKAPGSFAPVSHISDEGILISPQELTPRLQEDIARGSRTPDERRGDLEAQKSACLVGSRGFLRLFERYGDDLHAWINQALAYTEEYVARVLQQLPLGTYYAEDVLEDVPTIGEKVRIALCTRILKGGNIEFDFSGTDPQQPLGINATEAVTRSACYYVVRCLAGDIPTNSGCWQRVSVLAPEGSLVNARCPAPVVGGNTETSQRIVDVVLQTLQQAVPERVPACSQGTMNNLALGSENWAYYETLAGGAGGGPLRAGASCVHTHMTNTRNTPVEALENELPLRVIRYEKRAGSGGRGRHPGGDGVIRELELLRGTAVVSLMTDRRSIPPPGASGGSPGKVGINFLVTKDGEFALPSKGVWEIKAGDRIRLETPGGGGWGTP